MTASDLASLRDMGGHARGAINLSPNGRWVVFQLQSPQMPEGNFKLTWMAVSTDGGKAIRIADGGDVLLNPSLQAMINGNRPEVRAQWSPDSKSFAYLVRRGGQTQIWQSRPDRKGQVQLTHSLGDVIEFAWSRDGSSLYFKTGFDRAEVNSRGTDEAKRGYFYDDRFHPTQSTRPEWRICGNSDFGRPVVVSVERSCDPVLWTYDIRTKSERTATEAEVDAFKHLGDGVVTPEEIKNRIMRNLRRSLNGDTSYAWRENTEPELYKGPYAPLTLFALIDGEIQQCVESACRAYNVRGNQDLWWRQSSDEIVFFRREGSTDSQLALYAWRPKSNSLRKLLQTEDWLSDCAQTGDHLVCLYETWTEPRKIVSMSLADGSIETLYDPNPEFDHLRFSRVEKLEWQDAYGNTTYGHLVYPDDYQPGRAYPLVIVTYRSRGFLRGGVGDEFPILPLAAEGFFVLSQDMPDHTELIAKYTDFNARLHENQYDRKSALTSQELIIERLADDGLVDKNRVAITGVSEGQAQVNYALIYSDIKFAAAITSGAHGSPSEFYLTNNIARERARRTIYGSPDDPASGLHKLSIGLNADRIHTPLLINVSDDELLGSVENYVRLKDAGKWVEMYVFPGEHHIKWRPDHRLAVYRRNIQWLKFWLKGEEDDDPVSPGQYERWREMRDRQCAEDWSDRGKPSYCEYAGAVH